ncbi:MAG: GDP-mannose 4,6-dehydratase [Magnetococcales bacterium]|nr:GDP-mannose 4,6-dehydratase [Magnetococcales bacterium]
MNNIFVIGSNSFSGSTFVEYALQQKVRVHGISRSDEPVDCFLPYKMQEHADFTFHRLDLNHDLPAIVELLHAVRPPYVVNFAAQSMVGESWQNPGDWFMTNTVSTIKFHDALRKCDFLKRYVHISTPEVYGSCSGHVKEDFPLNPSTPYAVSRAAADMSLKTFRTAYNFPVVSTRAANVYGPGQQLYRIIPRAILFIMLGNKIQLHGGGVSTRSFIHMRDVSDATWKVMLNGQDGDVYHISTNEIVSIRELVERICDKMGVAFEDHTEIVGERMGKDAAYHLDSTKIRHELGWKDHISLDQGLDECIVWVQNNLDKLKTQSFDYQHKP